MDNNVLSQIMQPMQGARASFALDYPALKSFEMGDTTAASDTLPSLQFPSMQEAQQAAMLLQAPKLPQFAFPEMQTPTYKPATVQSPAGSSYSAPTGSSYSAPTEAPAAAIQGQKTREDLAKEHNDYLKSISKELPSAFNTIGGSMSSPFTSFFR